MLMPGGKVLHASDEGQHAGDDEGFTVTLWYAFFLLHTCNLSVFEDFNENLQNKNQQG